MRLPRDTERHAIFGKTGTGKTVFALWTLSHRSFHRMPWIIVDFKGDPIIAEIPGLEEISINAPPPKRSGLYVVRPQPADVDEGLATGWLYRVWARGNTGLMIDEGYMLNARDRALRACLTQGRSKHIPMICLSQRPAWICPFIMSEAEHLTVFYLQTPADIDRVQEWLPGDVEPGELPNYHSYHYQVGSRELARLGPCEGEAAVLQRFQDRKVKRWRL